MYIITYIGDVVGHKKPFVKRYASAKAYFNSYLTVERLEVACSVYLNNWKSGRKGCSNS